MMYMKCMLHFSLHNYLLRTQNTTISIDLRARASSQLTTNNHWHWPCYCTVHVCVDIHFVIVCGLFVWKWICAGFVFIICLIYVFHWISSYQEGRIGIQLTASNPQHFCDCSKACPTFSTMWFLFCVQWLQLRWEVIVRFHLTAKVMT